MPNIRANAKQDIARAIGNTQRIPERLGWLMETYYDYPDFVDSVKSICEASFLLEESTKSLLALLP